MIVIIIFVLIIGVKEHKENTNVYVDDFYHENLFKIENDIKKVSVSRKYRRQTGVTLGVIVAIYFVVWCFLLLFMSLK